MARTTLSEGALNRTVLARQLLLERSRLSLPRALERVAGIQDQYAPTAYIGLWSRTQSFRREALTRSLERRSVIQGTLMRGTIHVVSARDYPLLAAGVRETRREWWLPMSRSRRLDVDYPAMAEVTDRLLADGPLRRKDLVERLEGAGFPREAFEGVGFWIDLVRVPPSGTWDRRRADLYQTAGRWLGSGPSDVQAGLRHLVVRYLGAFGPATPPAIGWWAGTPVGTVMPHLEQLGVKRFRTEDGTELVDLPRRQIVAADTLAPVRSLGPWEAVLLTHARPSGILPEEFRPLVFKNPHSVGTILVDGRVAAAWKQEGASCASIRSRPSPGAGGGRWRRRGRHSRASWPDPALPPRMLSVGPTPTATNSARVEPLAGFFRRLSFILGPVNPSEFRDARYRALADPIRRRLLRVLEDSLEPCDVETLAGAVELHPNTVRGHMDLLERARLVIRSTRPRSTPGRPRVVYEASSDTTDTGAAGYRLLAELLTATIRTSAADPVQAAESAGRSWGWSRLEALADQDLPTEAAEEHLTAMLDEIGFEPSVSRQDGRTVIELNDCPFRELARQHTDVVCSLHLGLMRGAAEALGDTEIEHLQPFAGPSMCRTVISTLRDRST